MFFNYLIFLLFLGSTIAFDCYSVDGRTYCRCPSGEVEDLDHDGIVSCENNVEDSVIVPLSSNNFGYSGDNGYILAILILVFIILVLSFLLLRRYRFVDCTVCVNPFQRSLGLSFQMRNPPTDIHDIPMDVFVVHNSHFSDENVNDSVVYDSEVVNELNDELNSVSDYHSVEFN